MPSHTLPENTHIHTHNKCSPDLDDTPSEIDDEGPIKIITHSGKEKVQIGTHCTWSGVTCGEDGRVLRIEMNVKDIQGTIPPEIGRLEGLERLYLYSNQLT